MAASFFEVFPVLKLNKGMTDLLEEATVEKVTASQARNRIQGVSVQSEADFL